MMFFLTSFWFCLKRILKPSLLFMFIFFCMSLLIGGFIQNELKLKISIGLLYEKDNEICLKIADNIMEFSDISVIVYEDFDDMREALAFGKIESGYVLENMDRYVLSGSVNRGVKLYKTPKTISDGFTNELMFAALMKATSPYIAYNYLRYNEINTTLLDIQEEILLFYENAVLMDFNISNTGESEQANNNRITSGITSVYILVLFFFIAIQAVNIKSNGFYEKLNTLMRLHYICAYVLANTVAVFIITSVSAPYIGNNGVLHNLLCMAVYVLALGVLCVICALFARASKAYHALFPIISTASILLGGAFFDIDKVSPVLGSISYLFPTYHFTKFLY